MRTGQQVLAGESRMARPAPATVSLEVPAGTAGAARTGPRLRGGQEQPGPRGLELRLLTADEVSPLGDICSWA